MLSQPRIIFGIHSISPYRLDDKLPYGTLKVVGSANLELTSELEQLYAGSNKFAWAAENKTTSTSLTAKVKAYPDFMFELFLGATLTKAVADSAGTVSALTNAKGTSVAKATTGITSIAVKVASKANLKFGKYVVKAVSANTIAIYLLSDIDASRGTDVDFKDDSLELDLGGNITIATTVAEDIDELGLTFTGGSAATAFVVGDTATFEVLPPSQSSTEIVVGSSTATMPAFGALLMAQKRATGEMFEIDAHNCVGGGLPISLEENAFSQPELKMTCLYESSLDRVFTIRHIQP